VASAFVPVLVPYEATFVTFPELFVHISIV